MRSDASPIADWSFAQRAALVIGVWWTVNGIGAFLIDPNLVTGNVHGGGDALGLTITVNGWHALFHLLSGLIGLAACLRTRSAAWFLLASGVFYLVVGGWGLFAGGTSVAVIAVDSSGDVVHMIEGAIALGIGAAGLSRLGAEW